MGIVLRRICMENYKLFDKRTVEFADALSVFDGPNGYGKTSTFDAIELLITGDISRVNENEAISAKLSYAESFLAKDQSQDVVIRGEFCDTATGETLIIARCIPYIRKKAETKKKDLNPKSLGANVKTYFLSDFELSREQWEEAQKQEIKEKCNRFFGEQNVSLYTLLHYVRQEDRLSFFKESEDERTKVIEGLFKLKEYRDKLEKAKSISLKCAKSSTPLADQIKALEAKLMSRPKEETGETEYVAIAQGIPEWDKESLDFRGADSSSLRQELMNQLDGVEALVRCREEFAIDGDTRAFRGIPEEKRALAILAWKLHSADPNAEKLRQRKEWQIFCLGQNEELKNARYTSVNWKTLCQLIGAVELEAEFVSLTKQIAKSRENQSGLQKSLSELEKTRNMLHKQAQKADMLGTGTCPFCGQDWGSMEVLEEQFSRTKESLLAVLGSEAANGVFLTEQYTELFQQKCSAKWDALLSKLEKDVALQVFDRYPRWQDFCNAAVGCEPMMMRLGIDPMQIMLGSSLDEAVLGITELLRETEVLCTSLSAEYVALDQCMELRLHYSGNSGILIINIHENP